MKLCFAALLCLGPALFAADPPRFEVASVKAAAECTFRTGLNPGTLTMMGVPLAVVVLEAFQIPRERMVGPAWLEEQVCFDIVAKMPENTTKEQYRLMLQTLLAERFKFTFHKDSKLSTAYALVVDKNGAKFKESPPPDPNNKKPPMMMIGRAPNVAFKGSMTMASLARGLAGPLGGPVRDETNLKGAYDIDFVFRPETGTASPEAASDPTGSIISAVRDQLGLRLERRTEPVETLVIDRVEKVPTAN